MIETLATWYRTPKRELQKSAGGGAGTGAGKNWGCWPECWHRCWQAGPCVNTQTTRPASTCASTPASTPSFCQHLCQHPRQHFSGIPVSGSCTRSPGSQFYDPSLPRTPLRNTVPTETFIRRLLRTLLSLKEACQCMIPWCADKVPLGWVIGHILKATHIQKAPSLELWWMWGTFAGTLVNVGEVVVNLALFDSVNIWCIVFLPVLKLLACGRQSRCLDWTYKLSGGQKFSIKLSPLSVGFPQRRPLNFIKKTPSL